MFVTTAVGQALAFASKMATAMVIPLLASCISIYSTRRAFQVTFFSSITNCINLVADSRLWIHRNSLPTHSRHVSIRSWLVTAMAILLYGIIVASDLLVFQLASKHMAWKYSPGNTLDLNFRTTSVTSSSRVTLTAPLALVDAGESNAVFGNQTYIPSEPYVYLNSTPHRSTVFSVDGGTFEDLWDVFNVTATPKYPKYVNGTFSCYSGQQLQLGQVRTGNAQNFVTCIAPDTPGDRPYYPSIGFNKKSVVQGF